VNDGEATAHGVYDWMLGGAWHRRADRELGRAIAARFPAVPGHIRAAQDFHCRAAAWAAERGVARFIRCGPVTALPGRDVHDAVRAACPAAQVIYVSPDEAAHAWAVALLSGKGITLVPAPPRPRSMLELEPVAAMLAGGEPVCVIAGLLLHFVPAEGAAAGIARLAKALPSGSVLALSLGIVGSDATRADGLLDMYTPARIRSHTAEDVTGWLEDAGLEIVPPGVKDVRAIPGKPGWAARRLTGRTPGHIAGVLARKP